MYKFFSLVLLSALAAVGAERININGRLDQFIEYMNDKQRQLGTTSAPLPEIPLGSKVKYSHAEFLGLDSLKRTADSWQEVKGNDIVFDIRYGFGMLTLVLPNLEIAGTNMTAYARIRNNSVHISYTVSDFPGKECHVKLNECRIESLENVEFGSSMHVNNFSNVNGFFKLTVIPALNAIITSNFENIESSLQALCKVKDFQNAGHFQEPAIPASLM